MSESVDRILKADPNRLAKALSLGTDPARVWLPDELAAVFRHQMAAPVSVDIVALGPPISKQIQMLTDAQGLLLKSFRDLFEHPQPPVELLELVKDFAKMNRDRPESLLPNEVATALYYLSIAAAVVKLGKRITTLNDDELQRGFQWCSSQSWIDAVARNLLEDATTRLSSGASAT